MYVKCNKCDHKVKTSASFFANLIGGALPVGVFWAWVTYFFADTGFAFAICTAMVVGGVALLAYKEEIIKFIVEKGYQCKECGSYDFDLVE